MRAHKTQNALAFMTIFQCLISYRGSLALAIGFAGKKRWRKYERRLAQNVFLQK